MGMTHAVHNEELHPYVYTCIHTSQNYTASGRTMDGFQFCFTKSTAKCLQHKRNKNKNKNQSSIQ